MFNPLCWAALAHYGNDSIMYWFGAALLPAPVYIFSIWFIKAVSKHKQHLNVYYVMKTLEVAELNQSADE